MSATAARLLLAGRFQAVLSTQSQEHPGYPFGSLVPYCLERTGQPLLLLSDIAQHTRNLHSDPRCALTIGEPGSGDIQRSARLTCSADCTPVPTGASADCDRYFRYFPRGRVYFEELDFRFYRLQPLRFHYISGFGSARWLGPERLLRRNPFSRQEEQELVARMNDSAAETLDACFRPACPDHGPAILVGVDTEGADLRRDERVLRVPFSAPVAGAGQLLERLLETARLREPS